MEFLRFVLKFFAVILAIILSFALLVSQIVLMTLQSASFVITESVIKELVQAIDLSSITGQSLSRDGSVTIIYVPEKHCLSDGPEETLDADAMTKLLNSFAEAFENLPEDKKQQMDADMENLDVKRIIEGLTGESVDNMSEDEAMSKLSASLIKLESVQNVVSEIGANALDKLINDSTGDVISEETITKLFSNIATEIKDKTGVELPDSLVDIATQAMEENKEIISDSLNSVVTDEGFIGNLMGVDASSPEAVENMKQTIQYVKLILSTKTRLILLGVVVVLGGIIFLLFFKSKAGLIWDAVITFMSSTSILSVGLVLKADLETIASMIPEMDEIAALGPVSGILKVLGNQFIKTALIGYAVFALLVTLFVVLKVLKKKKLAKQAQTAAAPSDCDTAVAADQTAEETTLNEETPQDEPVVVAEE